MEPETKTVVFIGGTAYSGSTLLNLLVANDPAAFACGEVNAFVRPLMPHHLRPRCGCGDSSCNLWNSYNPKTDGTIHEWLFETLPSVRYLVDSSKDVGWIRSNTVRLQRQGYAVHHLLIWKTPEDYFKSRFKRGEKAGWERSWTNYHHAFLVAFDDCVTVNYESLVRDPGVLDALCKSIGMQNFPGKANYWEKTQHILFGNSSARIHLVNTDSEEFARMEQEFATHDSSEKSSLTVAHRSVQYTVGERPAEYDISAATQRSFDALLEELKRRDVRHISVDGTALELKQHQWWLMAPWYIQSQIRHWWRHFLFKFLRGLSG